MSVVVVPGNEAQGAPVPYGEYQRVCQERDHWKQKAIAAQRQVSRLTAFAGCSKLTEGQRIRTWAALQVADASPPDKDGWRRINLFDIVTVAGINTTPKDDSPEERRRAIKNAPSIASKALALTEELGVLERTEPVLHHDDPDDPQHITSSSAHVRLKVPAQEALRTIVVQADPRPAKKSRGIHVKPIACPNCGQTEHIHIKCSACGYYCTGQELAEIELQRLEQEQDEAEIIELQILQPRDVETTEDAVTASCLQNLQPEASPALEPDVAEASTSEEAKPDYLAPDPAGIPTRLMDRRQWVNWKAEQREGRWTKVPIAPATGRKADTKDPDTWGTLAQALKRYRVGGVDGIGYVFAADDPFVGVDLDELDAGAGVIVRELNSYTEQSPSSRGVHVIVEASKPGPRCRAGAEGMYDQGRFFAMTGKRVEGSPASIEPRQEELQRLYDRLFPTPPPTPPRPSNGSTPDDDELLERAAAAKNGDAFTRLWRGDLSDVGGDRSLADWHLVFKLKYWTDGDPARIDRLFRQSGLFRAKWDRPDGTHGTYGERTIRKALGDA